MFTITNANRDELTPDDGHKENHNGWHCTAYPYTIASNSGHAYHGTYRAGLSHIHDYDNPEELHTAILECLARDIDDATEYGQSRPDVRSLIAQISEDYGETDPLRAYDTATELYNLTRWYWTLTTNEQTNLTTYREQD